MAVRLSDLRKALVVDRDEATAARKEVDKALSRMKGYEIIHTGSAFEGLRVANAEEFDFMFAAGSDSHRLHSIKLEGAFLKSVSAQSSSSFGLVQETSADVFLGNAQSFRDKFKEVVRGAVSAAILREPPSTSGPAIFLDFRVAQADQLTADFVPAHRLQVRFCLPHLHCCLACYSYDDDTPLLAIGRLSDLLSLSPHAS
eukprot:m.18222 g.18222  ORF g.18222 m.18222 type:complete len:200 (-) comp3321_c0_seq1:621-1220(-)